MGNFKVYLNENVIPDWWKAMSRDEQKQYIKDHPGSEFAKHPVFNQEKQDIKNKEDIFIDNQILSPDLLDKISKGHKGILYSLDFPGMDRIVKYSGFYNKNGKYYKFLDISKNQNFNINIPHLKDYKFKSIK